jgi:MFS family permease
MNDQEQVPTDRSALREGEAGGAAPKSESGAVERGARRRASRVLLLSSLGILVIFMDTTIVNVAFETISRSFHASAGHLSWILNAYSLVFAAALMPAGQVSDRYGRKRMFLVGLGGFMAMSALCGLAPDVGVLIAGRAFQGIFAALIVPASLALILPEFPGAKRHAAVGTWGAMGAAAVVVGPALGALLIDYVSWRWIFLLNIPVCALLIAFGNRMLEEYRDPHGHGIPDPVGGARRRRASTALLRAHRGPFLGLG